MFTTKTDDTVNAEIIIPLYPVGSICLFNINRNEAERSAAIDSEDIKLALAIILPAVDMPGEITWIFA
jgi:hypothetical protein